MKLKGQDSELLKMDIDMRNFEILSQTSLFILGVIAEKPSYPYAISKILNHRRKHFKSSIPVINVYGTIKMLNKKKYITGKKVKNSSMPEKTIYNITSKGRKTLRENIFSFLSIPEESLTELRVAIFMMGFLDKATAVSALKEHKEKLEKEIALRKKMNSRDKAQGIYYSGLIAVEHALNMLKVDLKTINALLKKVETDNEWNLFPVPFWRNEVTGDE